MIVTPRCRPVPMPDDVIEVVTQMGEDDGSPDRKVFSNIHKDATQDDNSCTSDNSWEMRKDGGQEDQMIIVYDDAVDDGEVDN